MLTVPDRYTSQAYSEHSLVWSQILQPPYEAHKVENVVDFGVPLDVVKED